MRPPVTRAPRISNRPQPPGLAAAPALVLLALALSTVPQLSAQATAPAAEPRPAAVPTPSEVRAGSPEAPEDELMILSPFEVNTSKDRGFLAVNAGTATKLGLDLNDLAAPYSVMTGEFIRALGITNIEQAAIWATNGAPVLDGQGADTFNANGGARINNASTMYYARGVITNAGQQRNFFLNAGTNDSYNIERIDFGRGPNAVLFNVGANSVLGGGISTVGKRARVDRDFNTFRTTVGSWDYYRTELDMNKVLRDGLALRANLMWQDRGGWQAGEQDDRTGITLAGTWRINERSELNIEVRRDKMKRSRPPIPFGDNVSGWNGRTIVNGPISNYQLDGRTALAGTTDVLQTLPNGSSGQGQFEGIWRMGDSYIYDSDTGTVMNWLHMGSTRRGDENPWVPLYIDGVPWSRGGNDQILPIGNYGATGGNTAFRSNVFDNGGSAAFTHMLNLPSNRFGPQLAGSQLEIPTPRDTMIPNQPLFVEETQGVHLNFTHKFSEELFVEFQADVNRVDMDMVAPNTILGSRVLFIDINRNLPTGGLNPHYLDAYSEGNLERGFRRTDNAGVRAALAYRKDLGKWGDYSFNLSAMATAREVDFRRYILSLPLNADPRDWHSYPLRFRYYQHDSARPFDIPNTPISFFNRTAVAGTGGADNTYTTATSTITPRWVLTNIGGQAAEERKERNESYTFAFAGRWFDNKLIISPGVRVSYQDTDLRWAKIAPGWGALPNDPSWDGVTIDERYWRPDAPADWKTLTWTPRNAAGTPLVSAPIPTGWTARPRRLVAGTRDVFEPDPLYAGDRFRDDYNRPKVRRQESVNTTVGMTYHLRDWMALKLSYGTSFLPPDVGRWELTGDDAKPETGIAYEAALTFSLFNNRLAVTPRYYFNRRENALTGSPARTAIDNLMNTRAWDDPYPGTRNPFNYPGVNGDDYFAQYNDGYELEIAGEITRGWRLSASFGTARIVDYDRWPQSQAYILSRASEFRDALEAAGGMIDTTRKPTNGSRSVDAAPGLAVADPAITDDMIRAVQRVDGSINDPQARVGAINNYNNIWVNYDNVTNQTDTLGLRRLSAKLVTDYTIQSGMFRGLRYGVAVYYVDRDRAGFRGGDTIENPAFNPNAPISSTNRPWVDDPNVDGNTFVWVKRPFQVDGLLGYTRRLRSNGWLDGKELELQLNIRNLLNQQEVYWQDDGVTLRPPGGDITAPNRVSVPGRIAQYQRPINFELTATLKF